jgi:hypothetical protein
MARCHEFNPKLAPLAAVPAVLPLFGCGGVAAQ